MIQQRRNSRRFVLSELRTFGRPLADGNGGGGGAETAVAAVADVDSDDADDGFCIQLEPMPPLLSPTVGSYGDLPNLSSSLHDDRPPSKHEIAQWKSIKNLKSGIT